MKLSMHYSAFSIKEYCASPSVGVGLLANVNRLRSMRNRNTIFMSYDKSGLGSWVLMLSRASQREEGGGVSLIESSVLQNYSLLSPRSRSYPNNSVLSPPPSFLLLARGLVFISTLASSPMRFILLVLNSYRVLCDDQD